MEVGSVRRLLEFLNNKRIELIRKIEDGSIKDLVQEKKLIKKEFQRKQLMEYLDIFNTIIKGRSKFSEINDFTFDDLTAFLFTRLKEELESKK